MFKKKDKNIPKNLEDACNFVPSLDDWALIEEAFVYAVNNEDKFHEVIKQRNLREHKKLWKRYMSLRDENGQKLIGFLFMKRNPKTAENICKRFKNPKQR